MTYLWVALGGALGSMARFWCSDIVARLVGETFPWGTLGINILGSFVIGLVAALSGPDSRLLISPEARVFLMVGICGGYTTFSSFSLQTLNLIREAEWGAVAAYIGGSVALCLIGVWLGYAAGALVSR